MESFRDLMRLAHGFERAKVFFAANDLDLFSRLGEGREASDLAFELQVESRALTLVLNALTAMGLLVKEGDRYRNAPVAARFLVAGEGYRGNIFKHIHHCWEAWNELPGVIREGRPATAGEEAVLGKDAERTRTFIRGMDDVARDLAPQVVSQLDLSDVRMLLDVGGGPGTYAAALLRAHPGLAAVHLFDLPGALQVAREKLAALGLLNKVHLTEGDFHKSDFPGGMDGVWISQVFHSQDEEGCRMLVEKASRALNPGGRLWVHEFLLDEGKVAPPSAALFAVHMLVMTEGGRAYSGAEIAAWLEEEGFEEVEVRKVSEDTGMVTGRKPR